MISAAVLTPPSEALRIWSPPASTLLMTSFRSFSAVGWMPSSVAMRTSTSLRWRSRKAFSTAPAWSESRWTRIAATICGCSLRSSSATEPASIHFRLSMPVTSLPCRMRSISRLALSSPSALRSTDLTYSSVSATSMLCSPATLREAFEHAVDASRAGSTSSGRSSRRGVCTSFGVEVLEDLGGLFLAERHQQDRGVLGRPSMFRASAPCSCWLPVDPVAHDAGHRGRVLLGDGARAVEVLRRRAAPAAPAARGRRRQRCRLVGDDVQTARRGRGVAPARPCSAGRTRPNTISSATSASAAGHGARRAPGRSAGLLPQRQRLDRGAGVSTRNGALITLTESPRSWLKPMLSCTSAVSLSISSLVSGVLVVLPLASVVAAVVDDHRGVQALDGAGGVARHAHRLVDLVVGDAVAPLVAARARRRLRGLQRRGRRR